MKDNSLLNNLGLLLAKELFLKSQLVELFELIKSSGLNPSDFTWQVINRPTADWHKHQPRLTHIPSNFYCDLYVHLDGTTRAMMYTPGLTTRFDNPGRVDWANLKMHIQKWLNNLKREIESPDVWDMSKQEREALASSPSVDSDNSPFTAQEKVKVHAQLEELKQYLLTAHRLDPELVEARLQYLSGAVDRLGRIDWKGVALSTVLGLLTEAAGSTETFHDVMRFVGGIFREIYKSAPLLLRT